MDLDIHGKWAVVCGASKGLGRGCAQVLAEEGVNLVLVARGEDPLRATQQTLQSVQRGEVRVVAADITTPQGRSAALAACPQVDILVTNAAGPPTGDFRRWDRDAWLRALEANMLTPIELIKASIDGMAARGFGRIVNITSAALKAPTDALGLSNGARSGLTGFVAGVARSGIAAQGVTLNNLLPGAFDTDRLRATLQAAATRGGHSFSVASDRRRDSIPARRFGTPREFGAMLAFLCSVHAGYVTGQNIVIDGGAYPGTF